jgi:S-adenosylmethionine hydrolase
MKPSDLVKSPQIVTFLSDFGWCGGYAAACEAVVARLNPAARVLHLSHEVPVGDVAAGALVLARVAPFYPQAVHLAVVDPGVGTRRRPLALRAARGDHLVGPDNGLLMDAAESLGGVEAAWELDLGRVRLEAGLLPEQASTTFHGRDLFAPAAALLTAGVDPESLGTSLDPASLVRLPSKPIVAAGGSVSAPVIEIDRFGNVGLGASFGDLPLAEGRFVVAVAGDDVPEWTARVVSAYGDLLPAELGLIKDSWGQASLALNGASAAEFLSVKRGVMITLAPAGATTTERPR